MFHENFVSSVSCVYISIRTMIVFTIFGNRDKYVPWKDPCNHHVTNMLSREDQWFSSPFDNYATNHERISVRSAKKRSVLAPLLTVKTRNPFIYRVGFFFSLVPPNFSTKKKTANQPIRAAAPVNPLTKKGRDWLLSMFFFGTEIGGTSEEKNTLYKKCVMMWFLWMSF